MMDTELTKHEAIVAIYMDRRRKFADDPQRVIELDTAMTGWLTIELIYATELAGQHKMEGKS